MKILFTKSCYWEFIEPIEASKLTDEKIEKYLENMLLTNDIKLKERLDKSRKLNNINNNDNNNNNIEKQKNKKKQ